MGGAFFLGIIQGLTEFLPISSSAHLIVVRYFFSLADQGLAFDVLLHAGTLLAILIYYRQDWKEILRLLWIKGYGGSQNNLPMRCPWLLFVATLPAVVAGIGLHDLAETTFRDPLLVSIPLAIVGWALVWAEKRASFLRLRDLSWSQALFIGLMQALALIPGVSRSGITMVAARFLGFRQEDSAKISFLLSAPILMGAVVYEAIRLLLQGNSSFSLVEACVGFGASFVFGMLAIHSFLLLVDRGGFLWFGWYRVVLSLFLVLYQWWG